MTKKASRMYQRMQDGQKVKHEQVKKIETKRKVLEGKSKKAAAKNSE
jgi:hypothetical protein